MQLQKQDTLQLAIVSSAMVTMRRLLSVCVS